jgi:hypothetical protein
VFDCKKSLHLAIFLLFTFFSYDASAQEDGALAVETPPEAGGAAETAALPRSFRGFTLGMNLDDLKTALSEDAEFVFRGDRDVSFLPDSNQNLVDSAGRGMIKRAFFQIKDDAVFVMTFEMNTEKIDHYSVFTTFSTKYGAPSALDPRQSEWEDVETRVYIERPLTVKYIDKTTFDGIVSESRAAESSALILREEFLQDF